MKRIKRKQRNVHNRREEMKEKEEEKGKKRSSSFANKSHGVTSKR
jgi:hypothetical protein